MGNFYMEKLSFGSRLESYDATAKIQLVYRYDAIKKYLGCLSLIGYSEIYFH